MKFLQLVGEFHGNKATDLRAGERRLGGASPHPIIESVRFIVDGRDLGFRATTAYAHEQSPNQYVQALDLTE